MWAIYTIIAIILAFALSFGTYRLLYLELLYRWFKEFISYKDSIIAMKDKVYLYEKGKLCSLIEKMKKTWRDRRYK